MRTAPPLATDGEHGPLRRAFGPGRGGPQLRHATLIAPAVGADPRPVDHSNGKRGQPCYQPAKGDFPRLGRPDSGAGLALEKVTYRMRAAWWWIDRWRKSTAYTDMTAEQQGCYRNLLDELWLRDGLLPASEKALAQISGDHEAWTRCRDVVMARFTKTDDGWRNATHDEIMAESSRRAEKQRRYRARRGDVTSNVTGDVIRSPSPSPDQTPKKQTSSPTARSHGRKAKAEEPEGFAEFFAAHPRRVDRPAALKAWTRLNPDADLRAKIMAGQRRYAASVAGKEAEFIKHPGPWLNARRWEDESTPTPGGPNGNGKPERLVVKCRTCGTVCTGQNADGKCFPCAGLVPLAGPDQHLRPPQHPPQRRDPAGMVPVRGSNGSGGASDALLQTLRGLGNPDGPVPDPKRS